MNDFPWYRFYNETLTDRKIIRICRDSGQPKAVVIGTWSIILALASESPDRGRLLISEDIWLTPEEVRDETGLDQPTFDALIARFIAYGMLDNDNGYWEICNWDKRQFASDNSTERVRRHRKKSDVSDPLQRNVTETFQQRSSNVIDTDTDTDTDTEGEEERAREQPPPPPATASPPLRVKHQSTDRSPGVKRHRPPPEPEPRPETSTPSADIQAIGHIANAVTDVTGVSAKLNRQKMYEFASAIHAAGFTPEQIRTHFGRDDPGPGRWWYYRDDWRGRTSEKRQAEPPTLAVIQERIVWAVAQTSANPPQQRELTIMEKIRLATGIGQPAPNPTGD